MANKIRLDAGAIHVIIKEGGVPLENKALTGIFVGKTGRLLRGPNHPLFKNTTAVVKFYNHIKDKRTWTFAPEDVEVVTWRN